MASINYLIVIHEDDVNMARRDIGEVLGVSVAGILQAKYSNPSHPEDTFYVCHSPGPAAAFDTITSRAKLQCEETYLVLDATHLNPSFELSSRGYIPKDEAGFPFDQFISCFKI